jgi:hypothetical protein
MQTTIVTDELVSPSNTGPKAYGAYFVHKLAVISGGGVARASTNADSYAMFANAYYWWQTTTYFPGVDSKVPRPGLQGTIPINDTAASFPLSLWVDVSNYTDPTTADWDGLYTVALDLNSDAITLVISASPASATPVAPAAMATNACHGVSGNSWVQDRDVAAQSAAIFCGQTSNSVQ